MTDSRIAAAAEAIAAAVHGPEWRSHHGQRQLSVDLIEAGALRSAEAAVRAIDAYDLDHPRDLTDIRTALADARRQVQGLLWLVEIREHELARLREQVCIAEAHTAKMAPKWVGVQESDGQVTPAL